ncbi:Exosome non-catalytic core component [Microbotryomycetes sp. JL201]|nr:Exosome non-catalytic core component [Microbotryomycetes sp. JL201]
MATASSSRAQLLTPSNLRTDCRLPLEVRQLAFDILPSPHAPALQATPAGADGYAVVSHGLTKVSSSVFGPREPSRTGAFSGGGAGGSSSAYSATTAAGSKATTTDRASVNVEVGVAGWAERGVRQGDRDGTAGGLRKGGKDRRTIELAASLKATFEPVILLHLYPRSAIDIYIQVLEVDGSLLQAAINATTLALVSAGIPLTDYVCSLSLASYPYISPSAPPQVPPFELTTPSVAHSNSERGSIGSGSTTLVDLTNQEENALPNLTVAVLPRSGKVTLVNLETRVGVGRFEEMLRWGIEGSVAIQGAMEEAMPNPSISELFPRASAKQTMDQDDL